MTPRREEFARHAAENAEHDKLVENDIRLRIAASRAALIFEHETGWYWWNTYPNPPSREQLRERFAELAEDVKDLHRRRPDEGPVFWASSGHLVVVLFDYPNEDGTEIRYMVEVEKDLEPSL